MFDDKDACQLEQADGLEYINGQADMVAGYWRKEDGFYGVAVIDNDTGRNHAHGRLRHNGRSARAWSAQPADKRREYYYDL